MPTDLEGSELLGEKIDRREFIDLLKRMLTLDQDRRIRPTDALMHSFIMLGHLADYPHLTMCVAAAAALCLPLLSLASVKGCYR